MPVQRRISVAVRELVEFTCRTGDLGGRGEFSGANRALEGTRGHQRLQKARPDGYEKEVALGHIVERAGFRLEIKGRIDGVMRSAQPVWIEEIKTVAGAWDGTPEPLHWAQGKVYAAIFAAREQLPCVEVRLTYLELESDHVGTFRETFRSEELQVFLDRIVNEYADWIENWLEWCDTRDASIRELNFPFARYRAGQRAMAVAAYRVVARGGRLFVEAPTGIGKTVSVLYPAAKALAEGAVTKIFYLTAKTSGRAIAEKALADQRGGGLRLRSVTLTARDKICFGESKPCDPAQCPFAKGYFDRIKPALSAALQRESLTRDAIESIARGHEVCPFELSLDCATWADVIIGDYNHVFNPSARLRRFFDEGPGEFAFLVDEAHNLVERGRDMFSAELRGAVLASVRKSIRGALPACERALGEMENQFARFAETPVARDLPAELLPSLEHFLEAAEIWLARNQPASFRDDLLALYFDVHRFLRTAEGFREDYIRIGERADDWRVCLFCVDPARLLGEGLALGRAAVLFSGTLSPADYFRRVLGGAPGDPVLQLPSPFPAGNLCVLINDVIRTDFKARGESTVTVADAIAAFIGARPGNHLVFFPSYRYLEDVLARVRERLGDARVLVQRADMTDAERAEFLAAFREERGGSSLAGFAVMGGVFGEAIDLVGEHLVGAIVVGVGLPQVCLERDLIREHFAARGEDGFAFAYRFPGINRVLQAVGRVIRSETDRGAVLLIDARWREPAYADLLPAHWRPKRACSAGEIAAKLAAFWSNDAPVAQRPE